MAVTAERVYYRGPHPIHGVMLAGIIPLFLGALLSDIAYWVSHEIQWNNFASWLNAGGLVFAGLALLCAIIGLFASNRSGHNPLVYILLLVATWVFGFLNALYHARDAWASMPGGLILSIIVMILALMATFFGFSGHRYGGAK